MEYARVVDVALFATRTTKLKVPATEGVPEIVVVAALAVVVNTKPFGKVPDASVQVKGPGPPDTESI
jgi:hypothetical protein